MKLAISSDKQALGLFFTFSASIACLWLSFIASNPYPLFPDEAQYWVWSKNPDWGYYSKPPMVAWAISLSNKLFGDSDFTTRLPSPFAYYIATLFIYLTARKLYNSRTALFSAALFITLPGVAISSTLVTTDPVLIMFWSISLYLFVQSIDTGKKYLWILLGVSCGLGMMSKYNFVIFFPSALLFLLFSRQHRHYLKSIWPYVSAALAFAMFAPNIYWNWQHNFASFIHVARDNAQATSGNYFNPLRTLEFFASQFGIFGPLLFGSMLYIYFDYFSTVKRTKKLRNSLGAGTTSRFPLPFTGGARGGHLSSSHSTNTCPTLIPPVNGRETSNVHPDQQTWAVTKIQHNLLDRNDAHLLLISFSGLMLLVMFCISFLTRSDPHWASTSYVAASILTCRWLMLYKKHILATSLVLHFAIMLAYQNLSAIHNTLQPVFAELHIQIPDPLERGNGWDELGEAVSGIIAAHPGTTLMTNERKLAAELIYYVKPHPFNLVMWNYDKLVRNHFQLKNSFDGQKQRDLKIIYVFDKRGETVPALPYFTNQKYLATIRMNTTKVKYREFEVYLISGYKG